jgi:eukaryotic-like serine/threonine-protein kinase
MVSRYELRTYVLLMVVPILIIYLSFYLLSFSGRSGTGQHALAQTDEGNTIAITRASSSLAFSFSSFAPFASNNVSTVAAIHTASNNSLLYDNSSYGIRFQSPSDWKKIEILAGRITTVEFTLLPKNTSIPDAVIDISIEKSLGNITTLGQYGEAADRISHAILGNFTSTESRPTILSGQPAIARVLDIKQPTSGIHINIAQVFTLKNDKAYGITYTAPAPRYLSYLPVVQQIINSFQITK